MCVCVCVFVIHIMCYFIHVPNLFNLRETCYDINISNIILQIFLFLITSIAY